MGVAENFKRFRDNYLIPDVVNELIRYRYSRITQRLNRDFRSSDSSVANSLYIGSYGRDTAARGVSDIDVSFTLPHSVYLKYNSYLGNGQSALLQAVRSSISTTYSSTSVGGDGQVVVVNFDDGVRFEVLPTFLNSDGKTFTYPDSNKGGSWRTTDPRSEIEAIRLRNRVSANFNLKSLCRMIRIWKGRNGVPISGLLIDTLAYNWIISWEHREKSFLYHDFMARDFFYFLSTRDRSQSYWLAPGSNQYVWRTGDFQTPAKKAYESALEAIRLESEKFPYLSAGQWRSIFGPSFPNP